MIKKGVLCRIILIKNGFSLGTELQKNTHEGCKALPRHRIKTIVPQFTTEYHAIVINLFLYT